VSALGRIVLNDTPPPPAGDRPGIEAAGEVLTLLQQAIRAHARVDGRVDYRALRASPLYRDAGARAGRLQRLDLEIVTGRPALAFWVNLYNALVLHGIVALGLRRSVWEMWNFFGRVSYRLGGTVLSVDEIEHGILRGNRRRRWPPWRAFGRRDRRRALALALDPRIHFAINCGARSCPLVSVYRPEAVDAQLDLAAASFVNQETSLDAQGRIACSRIFKWYRSDFEVAGGLRSFLQRYLDQGPVKLALAAGGVPCRRWRSYSWALQYPPVE
jgi:hypothetical protein